MARITLRQLLDHAAENGYGVPAFNINNMEQGLAMVGAAAEVDAPLIIQASRGARNYANDIMLTKMIDALAEIYPDIPLCMHQDHGNSESTCLSAQKLCHDRLEQFGTAGQAPKIKIIPMTEMAKRYQSGTLDPTIAQARAA